MPTMTKVGKATPAMTGGKRSSNSWRPRKYQGALAGLGVIAVLARCSSGALTQIDTRKRKQNMASPARNSFHTRAGKVTTVSSSSRRRTTSGGAASSGPVTPRRGASGCALAWRGTPPSPPGIVVAMTSQASCEAVLADAPEVDDHQDEADQG